MSMKDNLKILTLGMMMASMESPTRAQDYNTSKPQKPTMLIKPKKPFNKRENVLKIIKDYNLIKEGKSKKGKLKQARIIAKIDKWIEDGLLKYSDLNKK